MPLEDLDSYAEICIDIGLELISECAKRCVDLEVHCGEQLWAFVPNNHNWNGFDDLMEALACNRGLLCGYLRRSRGMSFEGDHRLAMICSFLDYHRLLSHGGPCKRNSTRKGKKESPIIFTWMPKSKRRRHISDDLFIEEDN